MTASKATNGLILKYNFTENRQYSIFHHDQCVADLSSKYEKSAEQTAFIVQGKFRMATEAEQFEVRINGFAQFNTLNQLTGAVLYLRNSNNEIKVQLGGIRQIELKVLTNTPEHAELFKHIFTGPISLIDHDEKYWRLQTPGGELENFLVNKSQFGLAGVNEQSFKLLHGPCPQDKLASVNIMPLINLVARVRLADFNKIIESYSGNAKTK